MGETPTLDRSIAQFFFEVGFGSCWAEGFVRNDDKPIFPLNDQVIERAWEIAGEAHDDPAEFDQHKAIADAAPDGLAFAEAFLAYVTQSDLDDLDFGRGLKSSGLIERAEAFVKEARP